MVSVVYTRMRICNQVVPSNGAGCENRESCLRHYPSCTFKHAHYFREHIHTTLADVLCDMLQAYEYTAWCVWNISTFLDVGEHVLVYVSVYVDSCTC
jgi:hypothetical protein